MKLRIVHQNLENRGGDEQVMKKEIVEKEEQSEDHLMGVSAEDEFVTENFQPLNPSPISAYDPLLVSGKRKRKPKEMVGEVSPVIRRKRKSFASKYKDGTLDSGGTSMSKGDATVGGSSGPVKSPTLIRAEEVQSSMDNEHPSFLKSLVRSHVASCFWMGLPVPFCKLHLPFVDTIVVLENEVGEEFEIKYIAHKTGLSAGWRKFVAGNKLLEGDVLIFQLIEPCRFKVYIIRANDLTEVDGALSLLILDSQTKQSDAEELWMRKSRKKKRPKSLSLTVVQKKKQKECPLRPHLRQPEEPSGNDSDEVASEVLEGSKFSESALHFKDLKSFEEFHIMQEFFPSRHFSPGLYTNLAASVIVETVNIADAIRGCKLTTPRKEFEVWEKSLRSFELLGLNVGFLRARLGRLVSMAFESEDALDTRRYWDAQLDYGRTEDEIRNLEAKLVELKELYAKYDQDIGI
ncbi:hypothetical protein DH2020_037570 [Rehmannia glutinosa]|uniref:TF-B3 domain-containing protein n=1 Tax=Rehmannia glutinosa TaxID=99300 RepID=A0ABR0V3I6_REHGL